MGEAKRAVTLAALDALLGDLHHKVPLLLGCPFGCPMGFLWSVRPGCILTACGEVDWQVISSLHWAVA